MKKIAAILLSLAFTIMLIPTHKLSAQSFSANETYFIKNVYSGKYLQATDGINTMLYQNTFTAAKDQQFKLKPSKSGGVAVIPVINDGFRFDVSGASTKNGTKVKLYKQNMKYINAQHFKIKQNQDGTYRFVSELSKQEKVLEIGGPSKKNGAKLQIWDYVGAKNQKWLIIPISQADAFDSPIPRNVHLDSYGSYNMDSTNISMRITNDSSLPVITTDEFRLDTYRNGKWEEYSKRQYTKFDKKDRIIKAHDWASFDANLINASAKPLIEGQYRIVKTFRVKDSALPKFEVGAYFTAYNSMYTFTDEYYYHELEDEPLLRKTYFNNSSSFHELKYMNGNSIIKTTKDANDIEKALGIILDMHSKDIRTTSWDSRIDTAKPDYTLKFIYNGGDFDSAYNVEIGLCGTLGTNGYITMRKNGSLVKTIVVKEFKYNTIKALFN